MKKLFLLLVTFAVLSSNMFSQGKTYLVFEFMKVDNKQELDYWDVERFWENIHRQRIKNGEIIGWDMWSLKPGGNEQGYQYMTVSLYDNPVKMFEGDANFKAAVNAAYPNMSEAEFQDHLKKTHSSRDLSVRLYLELLNETVGNYEMDISSIAQIDFMKAVDGAAYEAAEIETFLPMHQKAVDFELKEKWSLSRIMSPTGSETFASHITVNMFLGFDQLFKSPPEKFNENLSEEAIDKIKAGLQTRDLKWTYIATLLRKVR
tara:strand:+ start:1427 stop:2209 length:783 start_codon:yes stop_codon:yes gene_type:complete